MAELTTESGSQPRSAGAATADPAPRAPASKAQTEAPASPEPPRETAPKPIATAAQPSPAPSPPAAASAPVSQPGPHPAGAKSNAPSVRAAAPPSAARQFVGWGDREYTLQLVAAGDPAGFNELATRAGLDPSLVFTVRLNQPDRVWWLLCYGRYESLEQAKQALSNLNPIARGSGAWPRRVGPLQAEQSR
ncbi:MAG: SPOR domain-containing protein [Xanthomonadales bacterium]|nr:SPOR domain-containing protein [Xanthomonadales bacterium]